MSIKEGRAEGRCDIPHSVILSSAISFILFVWSAKWHWLFSPDIIIKLKLLEYLIELEIKSGDIAAYQNSQSLEKYDSLGFFDAAANSPCLTRVQQDHSESGRKSTQVQSSPVCSKCTTSHAKATATTIIDDTPRKLRRMQALRNARFNQTGEIDSRTLRSIHSLQWICHLSLNSLLFTDPNPFPFPL